MIKSNIRKFQGNRKVIEVPKAVRDDYLEGEEVEFQKVRKGQKGINKK